MDFKNWCIILAWFTKKQIRLLLNWLFTHESFYWVFAVYNWVFVKFILGNTTLSLYLLYNINYFNLVSVNYYVLPLL